MRRYFTRIVALALVLFCSHSASLQAQSADGNAMRFSGALGLNTRLIMDSGELFQECL
jgi:hypothetical protein